LDSQLIFLEDHSLSNKSRITTNTKKTSPDIFCEIGEDNNNFDLNMEVASISCFIYYLRSVQKECKDWLPIAVSLDLTSISPSSTKHKQPISIVCHEAHAYKRAS
jgi:hypothetical protein